MTEMDRLQGTANTDAVSEPHKESEPYVEERESQTSAAPDNFKYGTVWDFNSWPEKSYVLPYDIEREKERAENRRANVGSPQSDTTA